MQDMDRITVQVVLMHVLHARSSHHACEDGSESTGTISGGFVSCSGGFGRFPHPFLCANIIFLLRGPLEKGPLGSETLEKPGY